MFENFLTELTATVLNAVTTIVAAAMPIVTGWAVLTLKKKWGIEISAKQEASLAEFAQTAVMTSSQALRAEPGSVKREAAVKQLQRKALDIGVKLGNEAAGEVVEASVNQLKRLRGAL